jgi:hypothetical protein
MLKAATLPLSYLCGCVALVMATAEPANAVMAAAAGGCNGSIAYPAFLGVASLRNGGIGSAAATAQEPGPANGCHEATGSCGGSPCSSLTCTFTMNDGTVSVVPYTVNPPISNSACATTFCKSKCE